MTCDELMAHIPGPDFPTGGIIYGRAGIREAYRTGRGHHPGPGARDGREGQAQPDRDAGRHRAALSGQQGQADRTDRRAGPGQGDRGRHSTCATNPTGKACASPWS
ncbi:MAG: hypothetical protein MZV70_35410 [Desulfobacterales bacterium]|nr:hypothetical protein [Desulfobacterales bacterium]